MADPLSPPEPRKISADELAKQMRDNGDGEED